MFFYLFLSRSEFTHFFIETGEVAAAVVGAEALAAEVFPAAEVLAAAAFPAVAPVEAFNRVLDVLSSIFTIKKLWLLQRLGR